MVVQGLKRPPEIPFVSLPLNQALMFFMDHPTVVATYFADSKLLCGLPCCPMQYLPNSATSPIYLPVAHYTRVGAHMFYDMMKSYCFCIFLSCFKAPLLLT
jgi:hypothetical protein